MVALNRRDFLCRAQTLLSNKQTHLNLDDCVKTICHSTPWEFREAVRNSGKLLYRGEDTDESVIKSPVPDLLNDSTYGDQGEAAVVYFRGLEELLSREDIDARPSTGHIGTATLSDAMAWGDAVSVWPLGESFSYVWLSDRTLFYPGAASDDTRSLRINEGLSDALAKGKEVLFWSSSKHSCLHDSSFLAVPCRYSERLESMLAENRFGF